MRAPPSSPPETRSATDCSGRASEERKSERNLVVKDDTASPRRKAKQKLGRDDYRVASLDRVHRVSRFYQRIEEAAA
jgi:hypothetical protein